MAARTPGREELVAELCSAFLSAELGVVPTIRHADYLGAWLEVLKADNRAIFQAASLASKAAAFITGFSSQGAEKASEPTREELESVRNISNYLTY